MKLEQILVYLTKDPILDDLTALIKPLPPAVQPSSRFRREMRRRLLELEPASQAPASQNAA